MRKRGSLLAVVLLGALVAASVGAVIVFWPQIVTFIEEEQIRAERAERWALASAGQKLPGTPDLENLPARLTAQGLSLGAPIFVRIFKREFELEVWLKKSGGRFERFATYPICMWSGGLGPKLREGDRQAPEGFYTVDAKQLNPTSKYHRSFNLGFPNAFDAAHGRTGSALMVHGHCASSGCYAMTDPVIEEIWNLVTASLKAGQQRFQVQVFPFRMTDANLKRREHADDHAFWRQLKQGYDLFERDRTPPVVSVCRGTYAFRPGDRNATGNELIADGCPASAGI
jgi:murein L,D-transpeptidase YafK